MDNLINKFNSAVIKIGSAGITNNHSINFDTINHIASMAYKLRQRGKYVTIVTSGAIASGRRKLNSWEDCASLPNKQTYAVVGQPLLMAEYIKAFDSLNINVGQFLVSKADFFEEKRFSTLKDSYYNSLQMGIIPIFNENDAIATEEIKFSDNDELQSLIALNLNSDLMINLILYDGLLRNGKVVSLADSYCSKNYDDLSREVREGRGGLQKKLDAFYSAVSFGKIGIIGNVKSDILEMIEGKTAHTRLMPSI